MELGGRDLGIGPTYLFGECQGEVLLGEDMPVPMAMALALASCCPRMTTTSTLCTMVVKIRTVIATATVGWTIMSVILIRIGSMGDHTLVAVPPDRRELAFVVLGRGLSGHAGTEYLLHELGQIRFPLHLWQRG